MGSGLVKHSGFMKKWRMSEQAGFFGGKPCRRTATSGMAAIGIKKWDHKVEEVELFAACGQA